MAASHIRRIPVFLRMTEFGADEVTFRNQPVGERAFIVRNQPVILDICLFHDANSAEIMTKAELENIGCHGWTLNISKNHALMYPVFIQPDYADTEKPPITVAENGVISVRLDITDTQESADAISGMQADMWEAELAGFGEDDTALEHPSFVFQWSIGYVNRVASENVDAPGLLEATYYTKEQVNELLRQIAPEGTWGHIIGDITDQEDLIAHLEEKADKAMTLAGYGITDAYTKTEIDSKVASVFHYKGSVNSYADLPNSGMEIGDVYNVITADEEHGVKAGDNVAWNGNAWDVLAGEIDLSGYVQKTEKGEPNGVATLDENGQVPMSQMPILQLDSPPTTSTVGSVGQLAVWHDGDNNKDHLYHLCFISTSDNATLYHWEECVLLESGGAISGNFIPIAGVGSTRSLVGGVKVASNNNYGININQGNGNITIHSANQNDINTRGSVYVPLVPSNLDYAVRSVLPNVTEIPAATSDYSLVDSSATTNNHSHVYSHAPSTAPTYRLPQVTDTTISHYIELTVDFTNVQTYSFLDYQGEPIVPLFTPSIAAGDVYTFKMEYSAIKAAWLICPQKQGAVADDFVMRGEVGAANGVAGLDGNAKVQVSQLPIQENGSYGIIIDSNVIAVSPATTGSIEVRTSKYKPIVPFYLNHAVTAAITDSNHITLTDAQKATAQEVFGVPAPLLGTTAPTTSTVGVVGQLYVNTATSKTYHCMAITNTGTESEPVWSYTWTDDINAKGGTLQGALKYVTGTWQVGLQQYALVCCASPNNITTGSIISGYHPTGTQTYQVVCGQYNTSEAGAFVVGNGTAQQTSNALVLKNNGNLCIAGGYQQGITIIPAATTAYTLAEGVQTHAPEAASIYTLPAANPTTRTHECILTIKFSSTVLTYEFQDSAGTTLVPLPLNGDIEAGSAVTFLCRYNSLLAQWVIYPVMDGKEAQE